MAGGIHDLSIICLFFYSLTRGIALNKHAHTRHTLVDAHAEACPCWHTRANPAVSDHRLGDVTAKQADAKKRG